MPRIETVSDFRHAVRVGPYTFPGMYDIFGITHDGAALCHSCMTANRRAIVDSIATKCNDGWWIIGTDATCNTDSEVRCDHCNVVLQEEYADDTSVEDMKHG